jgi:RHS repeat-associated protein
VQNRIYDAAGQLTSLTDLASDGSTIVQYAYTYDAGGRLANETRSPVVPSYSPGALTLGYNADNQLTTYAGQSISYNPNGDALATPLNGTLSSLTYDARDRLTTAGGITYAYDAENRRLKSTSSAGATTYVVNPNAPLSQLLVSVAPSGSTTRNVYGLGLIYQDTDGTTVRYLHPDFRGSTVALTEAAGTVTGRVEYGPGAELSSQTGDASTGFLYAGQTAVESDQNGLIYMRSRYYNPAIHRFLTSDSYLGQISSPGGMNRYSYVSNNPIIYIDPTGFIEWLAAGKATLGLLTNSITLVGAAAAVETPPLAMFLGAESLYGLEANSRNLTLALEDRPPVSTGDVFGDIAEATHQPWIAGVELVNLLMVPEPSASMYEKLAYAVDLDSSPKTIGEAMGVHTGDDNPAKGIGTTDGLLRYDAHEDRPSGLDYIVREKIPQGTGEK